MKTISLNIYFYLILEILGTLLPLMHKNFDGQIYKFIKFLKVYELFIINDNYILKISLAQYLGFENTTVMTN